MATKAQSMTPQVWLGIATTCVGLFVSAWGGMSYIKGLEAKNAQQDMRLDQSDRDRDRLNTTIDKLTDKTSELSENVVKLTTVMEQSGLSKKAELPDSGILVKPADFKVSK